MTAREQVVERLRGLELTEEMGSHGRLSAIADAISPIHGAWGLGECRGLVDRLEILLCEAGRDG